jgi:hypothetical protein
MLEKKSIILTHRYFYLGLVLFFIFVMQDILSLKMIWLDDLQKQETFKIYSGLLLLVYLLAQFVMPYNKRCETPNAVRALNYRQHKQRGVLAPLFFFIHSTTWGVAYLLLLSSVYFANFLLGLFNYEQIKNPSIRRRFFKNWLLLHITLAVVLMALVGFHLYIVASY